LCSFCADNFVTKWRNQGKNNKYFFLIIHVIYVLCHSIHKFFYCFNGCSLCYMYIFPELCFHTHLPNWHWFSFCDVFITVVLTFSFLHIKPIHFYFFPFIVYFDHKVKYRSKYVNYRRHSLKPCTCKMYLLTIFSKVLQTKICSIGTHSNLTNLFSAENESCMIVDVIVSIYFSTQGLLRFDLLSSFFSNMYLLFS